MYEVIVLKEGYMIDEGQGSQKACGTITLVKGPRNVIVDTGNPWDKQIILDGLKAHELVPEKVDYVVCTHGHSDHVGNLNMFLNAVHIVSHDVCIGDTYVRHDFNQGIPYEIDDEVEVISTPGHTGSDVSVVVKNTNFGTVVITGDLFECLEDLEDYTIWQGSSEHPHLQQKYRLKVLKVADWIIPGHGAMFQVPKEYKQQLHMVMFEYFEQKTTMGDSTDGSSTSYSSYTVVEEGD